MRKSLFHFNFDTCLIVQERTLFIRLMDIAYIRQAGMVEYVSVVLILHSMDTFIGSIRDVIKAAKYLVCSPFDGNCIIFLSSMILSIV